ncbi:DUF2939 domain-containing protein [Endozoicomonas arenosclerae]|uniref:DUF2939 domain-containing protein n=1 Tax=Endozoicomonas arenosclerae TaxID=1633495 RepID=UPI00078658AB|nr:DUF2939 domain-containing protein [Endozoicomonas arenosclerae]
MKVQHWIAGGLLALLGWVSLAPLWSLYAIYAAASRQDTDGLNRYVDFPSVRSGLTGQIAGQGDSLLDRFIQGAVGGLVDDWVTPERLSALLGGGSPGSSGNSPDMSRLINTLINQTTLHYQSPERFELSIRHPDYGRVVLVMERDGIIYRLKALNRQ